MKTHSCLHWFIWMVNSCHDVWLGQSGWTASMVHGLKNELTRSLSQITTPRKKLHHSATRSRVVFNLHHPPSITGDTNTWIYDSRNALHVAKSSTSRVVSIGTVASLFLVAFNIKTFFVQILVTTAMKGLMIYPMVWIWVWIHISKIWR